MSVADTIDGARRDGTVSKRAMRWLPPKEREREAAALRAGAIVRPGLMIRMSQRDQVMEEQR